MSVEVITFGCRLNTYESEAMRDLATKAGQSGTIVVNTCAVTAEAERQARQAIRRAHRDHPGARIVVTRLRRADRARGMGRDPGVERVIGNGDKLKPETWAALDAPPAPDHRHHGRDRDGGASGDGIRRPGPRSPSSRCSRAATIAALCVIPYGRGRRARCRWARSSSRCALVGAGYREVVLPGWTSPPTPRPAGAAGARADDPPAARAGAGTAAGCACPRWNGGGR